MREVFWMASIFGFGILIGVSMVGIRMGTPELNSAQDLCSVNKGGVDYIVTRALQQNSVFCKNGAKFILEASK